MYKQSFQHGLNADFFDVWVVYICLNESVPIYSHTNNLLKFKYQQMETLNEFLEI